MSVTLERGPTTSSVKWLTSKNPILYKFQRKDYALTDFVNSSGDLRVTVDSVDLTSLIIPGDYVWIENDTGVYAGYIPVKSRTLSSGDTLITIDADYMPYISTESGGWINLTTYRHDYKLKVEVYHADTGLKLLDIWNAGNLNGEIDIDVSALSQLMSMDIEHDYTQECEEDTAYIPFTIKYNEFYNGIDQSQTTNSTRYTAVLAANQIGNDYDNRLDPYVVVSATEKDLLITPNHLIEYVRDMPFTISALHDVFMTDEFFLRFREIKADGSTNVMRGVLPQFSTSNKMVRFNPSIYPKLRKEYSFGGQDFENTVQVAMQAFRGKLIYRSQDETNSLGLSSPESVYQTFTVGISGRVVITFAIEYTDESLYFRFDLLGTTTGNPNTGDVKETVYALPQYQDSFQSASNIQYLTVVFDNYTASASEVLAVRIVAFGNVTIKYSGSSVYGSGTLFNDSLTDLTADLAATIVTYLPSNNLTGEYALDVIDPCENDILLCWRGKNGGDHYKLFKYSQDVIYSIDPDYKNKRITLYADSITEEEFDSLEALNTRADFFRHHYSELSSSVNKINVTDDLQVYLLIVKPDLTIKKIGVIVIPTANKYRTLDQKRNFQLTIELPDEL